MCESRSIFAHSRSRPYDKNSADFSCIRTKRRDYRLLCLLCVPHVSVDPATWRQMQNILMTVSNGLQGCKYCHDKFQRDYGPWTAFRTLDYGYTRVQVFNSSHLYLEQVSIDQVSGTCMHKLLSSQHMTGLLGKDSMSGSFWRTFYHKLHAWKPPRNHFGQQVHTCVTNGRLSCF